MRKPPKAYNFFSKFASPESKLSQQSNKMKSSLSLLLAFLALPFAYSSDLFDFEWTLNGPICGEKDMNVIFDRVAVTLEVIGTAYLQQEYGEDACIANVRIITFDKDDVRKLKAVAGEGEEERQLQGWSWPYGTGEGTCRGCPPDDDDRRELMGSGMLGKMITEVDDLAPGFLSTEVFEIVSAECRQIAGTLGWSVIFSI
jgi:hypothetical protein